VREADAQKLRINTLLALAKSVHALFSGEKERKKVV
jgi:hypothetical protein